MKNLLIISLGILMITGCKKSDKDFIGTWTNSSCGEKFPIVILKDGDVLKMKYTEASFFGVTTETVPLTYINDNTLKAGDPSGTTLQLVKDGELFTNLLGCSGDANYTRIKN